MPATRPAPSCSAILVAAGASRRMGLDKLAWLLAGVPVLRHALNALLAADSINEVIVVCPPHRWDLLGPPPFSKPVRRVEGGPTRQQSVARGLQAVVSNCRWVAVHDAARPLLAAADIERCVAAAQVHGAASLAQRVTATMYRSDEEDFSLDAVDRQHLWCAETPQVFETSALRAACARVAESGQEVTDEVAAVRACGQRVKFIASEQVNLKITTRADLVLAEALWKVSQ